MSASSEPSGALVVTVETGHWTVTRIAVVPALAAAKVTLKVLEREAGPVGAIGEALSSRTLLLGVTPLTVPLASTAAVTRSLGEVYE